MKPFITVCKDCQKWAGAKTFNQALMIKHTHLSWHERHEVNIMDEEGVRIHIE